MKKLLTLVAIAVCASITSAAYAADYCAAKRVSTVLTLKNGLSPAFVVSYNDAVIPTGTSIPITKKGAFSKSFTKALSITQTDAKKLSGLMLTYQKGQNYLTLRPNFYAFSIFTTPIAANIHCIYKDGDFTAQSGQVNVKSVLTGGVFNCNIESKACPNDQPLLTLVQPSSLTATITNTSNVDATLYVNNKKMTAVKPNDAGYSYTTSQSNQIVAQGSGSYSVLDTIQTGVISAVDSSKSAVAFTSREMLVPGLKFTITCPDKTKVVIGALNDSGTCKIPTGGSASYTVIISADSSASRSG